MNKLFKLIYINLLNLFDINKIVIARSSGVKSSLEKRTIIMGIIFIFYAFVIYKIFMILKLSDSFLILGIGYFISTLSCFVMNIFSIEPVIFKDEDNDILFSYPLSRYQILFSKLFNVYLKNIFIVSIIMISSLIAFYNQVNVISDAQLLMIITSSLVIPFIPMVLATIVSYIDDYYKLKNNNNYKYKIGKTIIVIVLILGLFLYFKDVEITGLEQGLNVINGKLLYLYPLINMFYNAIKNESFICFVALIIIPIVVIYIYALFITNNYLKICSMLKGIRKKEKFQYKKVNNKGTLGGLIKKEFIYLFSNKGYLSSSFEINIVCSLLLFILLRFVVLDNFMKMENIKIYFDLYLPIILSLFASLGCSTISAMSLEKNNMQIIRTFPVSMAKVLFSKWFVNVFIVSIFVIINGTMVWYFMDLEVWNIVFSYVIPLLVVMFTSLSGLLLDYRFIEKDELNDNYIIKQRLINIVMPFISILTSAIILIFPTFISYKILLGCYILIILIFIVIEIMYLIINGKKLLSNLFN